MTGNKAFGPYPGTVLDVHDGDTFRVAVQPPEVSAPTDIGWDITLEPHSRIFLRVDVRLNGCNAPELATTQGKTARDYLTKLMPIGTAVQLTSLGWDKYGGRSDCTIVLPDGRDLTAVMVRAGQAAPWNGKGPKPVPAS